MEEICPVCSDILSEINNMFDAMFATIGDIPGEILTKSFPALKVMYVPESLTHFRTAWTASREGISPSTQSPIGRNWVNSDEYHAWLESLPRGSGDH